MFRPPDPLGAALDARLHEDDRDLHRQRVDLRAAQDYRYDLRPHWQKTAVQRSLTTWTSPEVEYLNDNYTALLASTGNPAALSSAISCSFQPPPASKEMYPPPL